MSDNNYNNPFSMTLDDDNDGVGEYIKKREQVNKSTDSIFSMELSEEDIAQLTKPKQEAPAPKENLSLLDHITDVGKGAVRGTLKAGQEFLDTTKDIGDWINKVADLGYIQWGDGEIKITKEAPKQNATDNLIPLPSKPETTAGNISEGVAQFLSGFVAGGKLLKGVGVATPITKTGHIVQGMAKGAISDAAAFDPHQDRLSNLIQQHPSLQNPVNEYLQAKREDSNAEGRFKNALEGLGLGALTEGLFLGVRAIKNARSEKAAQSKPVVQPTVEPANQGKKVKTANKNNVAAQANVNQVKPEVVPTEKVKPVVHITDEDASSFAKAFVENPDSIKSKIDFNYQRIESSQDIRSALDKVSGYFESHINEATRGTVSLKQTEELANLIGANPNTLHKMAEDSRGMDSKFLAARQMLLSSTDRLQELAKKAADGTDEDLIALKQHVIIHGAIQSEVKGVQTEIARALSAMRITAESDKEKWSQIESILNGPANEVNRDFARKVAMLDDPIKVNKFIQKGMVARTRSALYEAWISSLLSSPKTHVINITSNTLTIFQQVYERAIAGGVSSVRGGSDKVYAGEAKAMVFGAIQGFQDALRLTAQGEKQVGTVWRSWKENRPITDSTLKVEHQQNALSSEALGLRNESLGKSIDLIGSVVKTPLRALQAEDEFFKTVMYRMELHAQAYRNARAKGLNGKTMAEDIATTLDNPPEDLIAQAIEQARYTTFTRPLGDLGTSFTQTIDKSVVGRFFVPFIRTPTNIMKYVGERTPGLNLLSKQIRENIKAGGVEADVAIARTTSGALMIATAMMLASGGYITGSFRPEERKAKLLAGEQEYSVKIGDKYVSFQRLDPIATFLGVVADAARISGEADEQDFMELMGAILTSATNNITNKTWLQGISQVIEAINDPERYGPAWAEFAVSSVVPNVVRDIRREDDPYVREVNGLLNAIKNKTPGWSTDLPPRRDLFGDVVHYAPGLGPDFVSPFYNSEKSDDPVRVEIGRLGIDLRKLPTNIQGVELTPEQYDEYAQLAGNKLKVNGKGLYDYLKSYINSSDYKTAPDGSEDVMGTKAFRIKYVISKYRQAASMEMMLKDLKLRRDIEKKKKEKYGGN